MVALLKIALLKELFALQDLGLTYTPGKCVPWTDIFFTSGAEET